MSALAWVVIGLACLIFLWVVFAALAAGGRDDDRRGY